MVRRFPPRSAATFIGQLYYVWSGFQSVSDQVSASGVERERNYSPPVFDVKSQTYPPKPLFRRRYGHFYRRIPCRKMCDFLIAQRLRHQRHTTVVARAVAEFFEALFEIKHLLAGQIGRLRVFGDSEFAMTDSTLTGEFAPLFRVRSRNDCRQGDKGGGGEAHGKKVMVHWKGPGLTPRPDGVRAGS